MREAYPVDQVRHGRWSSTEWGIFLTIALVLLVNLGAFGPGAGVVRNIGELAMSMVNQGNLDLDEYTDGMVRGESDLGDKASYNGHIYSGKAPGLSFFMVPVYIALKPVLWVVHRCTGGATPLQTDYIVLMAVCGGLAAIVSALVPVIIYKWVRLCGSSRGVGLGAALGLVPASWYFFYSTQISAKSLSAALILLAAYNCWRGAERIAAKRGPSNEFFLLAGLLAGSAVAVDYTPIMATVILGVYVAWRGGFRSLVIFGSAVAPMCLLTAVYHYAAFGSPLSTGYAHLIEGYYLSPANGGLFYAPALPSLQKVYGLVLSPYKGVLFYAPWAVLALLGVLSTQQGRFLAERMFALGIVLVTLGYNLLLPLWTGDEWGPRYCAMALPFLALMLAFVPRRLQWLLWPSVGLGTLINLLPVLYGGIVIGEKPWDNPITLYGGEILRTGAGNYTLRFISRNVWLMSPAVMTMFEAGIMAATGLLIWLLWRGVKKRETQAGLQRGLQTEAKGGNS